MAIESAQTTGETANRLCHENGNGAAEIVDEVIAVPIFSTENGESFLHSSSDSNHWRSLQNYRTLG